MGIMSFSLRNLKMYFFFNQNKQFLIFLCWFVWLGSVFSVCLVLNPANLWLASNTGVLSRHEIIFVVSLRTPVTGWLLLLLFFCHFLVIISLSWFVWLIGVCLLILSPSNLWLFHFVVIFWILLSLTERTSQSKTPFTFISSISC